MSRRSLFVLLALPAMIVSIAWPVSYYKPYVRRNSTGATAFKGAVDLTSVAVFRGDLLLFFQRSGPDQPPFGSGVIPSGDIYSERQFTTGGMSLRTKVVRSDAWLFAAWAPGAKVTTYRQVWVRVPPHMLALLLLTPLAVVLLTGR